MVELYFKFIILKYWGNIIQASICFVKWITYVNWRIKTACVCKHGPRKLEVRIINATEVSSGYREAVLPVAEKKTYWINMDLSDGG